MYFVLTERTKYASNNIKMLLPINALIDGTKTPIGNTVLSIERVLVVLYSYIAV